MLRQRTLDDGGVEFEVSLRRHDLERICREAGVELPASIASERSPCAGEDPFIQLHVVDARQPDACAACFTSGYGRSVVRSGSYLATSAGLRRFSPGEILRMLDFPDDYPLPPNLPATVAWPLVGNSLSVRTVRWVLSAIPGVDLCRTSGRGPKPGI